MNVLNDLDRISERLSEEAFLTNKGLSNEVGIHIFRYDPEDEITVETIAFKKAWLLKGASPHITRTSHIILSTFRDGKIGKFTLETPEEYYFI